MESASASENLDQDAEQMRSEVKGRCSGNGKLQHVSLCVCVCLHSMGNMRDVRLASVPPLAV